MHFFLGFVDIQLGFKDSGHDLVYGSSNPFQRSVFAYVTDSMSGFD